VNRPRCKTCKGKGHGKPFAGEVQTCFDCKGYVEELCVDCANCDGTGLLSYEGEEPEPCGLCDERGWFFKRPTDNTVEALNDHVAYMIRLWRAAQQAGDALRDQVQAALDGAVASPRKHG
jgi:hypothetical protein